MTAMVNRERMHAFCRHTALGVRAWVILLALALLFPGGAFAQVRVVATTAELESLARAVGGTLVSTVHLPANHADVAPLRTARVVVRVGLGYDAWLDGALERAGNAGIRPGARGYVDASREAAVLGTQAHADPRYWLDPVNARAITRSILDALAGIDPANRKAYETNRDAFLAELERRMHEWSKALPRPATLIAQSEAWEYFARRFRLKLAGVIETQPGVPPSPAHLAELAKIRKVTAIIREARDPARDADLLAAKTGAPVVIVASTIGAAPGAHDYFSLIDYNVRALSLPRKRDP
jgi:ABC-type Zn uptake system ZnuABC Zn-binding protein ZnuA